eukprot:TRINITY_DN1091_c0_g1_i1.p1 TRINITY_DN1091_c0_g1~~TRINITY_DN1091_c0_g1_i1.p1  ORF type:complete len:377 (+),score=102.30 TRINITY_DN1091_c0_g1_i1:90-1133(+)
MGNCAGGGKGDGQNRAIEKQLKQDRNKAALEMKLLLLGAGQSGKSTIAKQFKIVNNGNYDDEELSDYREAIIENLLSAIKSLVQGAEEMGIKIGEEVQGAANKISEMIVIHANIGDYKDDIKALWADKGIQEAFSRSKEFQLNDNAKYCLDNIDRIAEPDYVPTQVDVLHTRVRTTGVIEISFQLGNRKVRLVDVGGQRAERRKWMGCFDEVTAVLFCVALSEYDLKLLEDNETNRTQESMKIFQEVTSKWFPKSTIILFLNKRDLFEEKISVSPLKNTFPDYEGPNEFQPACDFIRDKFLALDPNAELNRVYPHITCATDTDSIRVVFAAVQETLIKTNLEAAGLM